MGYKWYFVRCQSGREDSIRKQLETRITVKGLQDLIPQILVPFERVTELKGGKRRVVSKKLYPGYLMVQADLSDPEDARAVEARATLRETPGFGDFLGTRGEATPLTEVQVSGILARMSDSEERPQVAINLRKGDMVKIKSGAFDGFDGTVDEIFPEKGMIKVTVTIFGRPTPVELEYWEVEGM
ncbi:MAG: transcription termination/antitermination protein NusG [Planctomycetota bacterium]